MESYHLTPAECKRYNSTHKYRLKDCPFQKQPLWLLYPGRLMMPDYDYNGINIPNEDMEGLEDTRKMSRSLRIAYDMEIEALSRHLGGKDKIYPFPAVDPEAVIDDPRLASISLEQGIPPDFEMKDEKSIYNNLQAINIEDHKIVGNARKEYEIKNPRDVLVENGKLPEYDWKRDYGEEYPSVEETVPSYNESPGDNYNSNNYIEGYKNIEESSSCGLGAGSSPINKILIAIFIVIMIILITCLCVGCSQ